MKLFSLVVSAVLLVTSVGAQEAAPGLPAAYQVQFENAWVRVTRVHYGPLEELPAHAHTPFPSAYVYLNDGGPVIFKHVGGAGTAAKRPATKAGAFRVFRGLEEIHEVENTTDTPSEFLRVEFKTAPGDLTSFRGKFERPVPPTDGSGEQAQFDHAQVRISRLWAQPGTGVEIAAAGNPVLLIALVSSTEQKAGEERWMPPGTRTRIDNVGSAPADWLRIDFKSKPPSH